MAKKRTCWTKINEDIEHPVPVQGSVRRLQHDINAEISSFFQQKRDNGGLYPGHTEWSTTIGCNKLCND